MVPRERREGECPALETRDLCVRFGGLPALHDISLSVERGEVLCLLGPNGGGKTTLLKAILGLTPSQGIIELFGAPAQLARHRLGYVPQRKGFANDFPASAGEVIVAAKRGRWPWRVSAEEREQALRALRRVRGEELIDRPLSVLSGGQTQRVFLARALIDTPPLVLIDEPLAGLDPRGREELLGILAELTLDGESAAVVVTHEPETVTRIANRVAYLDVRLRAVGTPETVLRDRELEAAAFAGADHTRHGH